MENTKRTVTCADLRKSDNGKTVVLNGWIHRIREHGGITFINLRDRYGITQVVVDSDSPASLSEIAKELHMEYVVAVEGCVRPRPDTMINTDMITGEIEVSAKNIKILSKAETLPFMIDEVQKDGTPVIPNEDLRLKYRYLDLRREQMKNNIVLRSNVTFAAREFLTSKGFLEIETPTFIKSTPEGARDYLVPSRIHSGKFYSLPQSPQLYKQLLMVSGFDKYFQIARCYRDEDARGDRQPEFTQIDMEMSFTNREEVLSTTEEMLGYIFKKTMNTDLPVKFDRLAWDDAFDLYGTDKPDLRFDMKMQDADFMSDLSDFAPFKEGCANCEKKVLRHERTAVKVLVVKNVANLYSRKKIEELEGIAKKYRAKGLAWMKVNCDTGLFEGGISKFFTGHEKEICSKLGAEKNDLLLFVSDSDWQTACTALGAVRKQLGKDLNLYDPKDEFHFVWIIDFPYFAWNAEENHWETEHHMFTLPQEKYWDILESEPGAVKGDLYDLVLNGYELASGSMRINDPELQQRIFKIVGYSNERAEKAFGFLVQSFKYGAPPHGGIAPGLDRLVMLMCHEESIHEVIAFPKNNLAMSPMDNSPSYVDEQQLKDLHINCYDVEKD
ncbi:MAG: aspartate--tRNA ligase [Treponemataceae bacterium]